MSDIHLYNHITPLNKILEKIDLITFVHCNRIDSSDSSDDINVIGQELIHIFPKMVEVHDDGIVPNIYEIVEHHLIDDETIFVRFNNINNKLKEKDKIYVKYGYGNKLRLYHITVNNLTEFSFEVKRWTEYFPDMTLILYGTPHENFHNVDQTKFGIVATAGVKELHQLVKSQQQTIDQQQRTIDVLLRWATQQGFQPPPV